MSRIRNVKPEFFRHELLQDLESAHPELRPMLVYAGLWSKCDKNGNFEYKPRQLKLDILPFLPFDMTDTLGVLEVAGMVERYEIEGQEYGHIRTFKAHQRVSGKEQQDPARFPVKPEGSNGEALGKRPIVPDYGVLSTDNGVLNSENGEREEPERKRFTPPSEKEASAYALHLGIPESEGPAFIAHHAAAGWKLKAGPMVDWKQAMVTWKKNWTRFNQDAPAQKMYRSKR